MEDWNLGMMGLLVRLSAGIWRAGFLEERFPIVFLKMTGSALRPNIPRFHHSTIPCSSGKRKHLLKTYDFNKLMKFLDVYFNSSGTQFDGH